MNELSLQYDKSIRCFRLYNLRRIHTSKMFIPNSKKTISIADSITFLNEPDNEFSAKVLSFMKLYRNHSM